jgi:hypothetical protein
MIQTQNTTKPPLAADIERAWRAIGFVEGGPPGIPAAIVAADIRCYRVMMCPACHHRGMAVKAFHRRREFRLLCRCRHCGAGTEA